jgi:hypothetical protein
MYKDVFRLRKCVPVSTADRGGRWSEARLIAGIAVSKPAEEMDIRLLCLFCVV